MKYILLVTFGLLGISTLGMEGSDDENGPRKKLKTEPKKELPSTNTAQLITVQLIQQYFPVSAPGLDLETYLKTKKSIPEFAKPVSPEDLIEQLSVISAAASQNLLKTIKSSFVTPRDRSCLAPRKRRLFPNE